MLVILLKMENISSKEKREEIWLSPLTKAPKPTDKSKKTTRQHKNAIKNFDYTTIADRLRTVSWGYDNNTTGVVKPVSESQQSN